MKQICVFCGSNPGRRPEYAAAARELGSLLAARGLGLVYGGGNVGLMGTVADAVLAGGGRVIGVIPRGLVDRELAHRGTDLRVVGTMHERKQLMHELSDAFVALPGGYGTLDELFEALTWAQLGMHQKPIGLVNTAGYWDHLLGMVDSAAADGLVRPEHRAMLLTAATPSQLLELFASYQAPQVTKWIKETET